MLISCFIFLGVRVLRSGVEAMRPKYQVWHANYHRYPKVSLLNRSSDLRSVGFFCLWQSVRASVRP